MDRITAEKIISEAELKNGEQSIITLTFIVILWIKIKIYSHT